MDTDLGEDSTELNSKRKRDLGIHIRWNEAKSD